MQKKQVLREAVSAETRVTISRSRRISAPSAQLRRTFEVWFVPDFTVTVHPTNQETLQIRVISSVAE